MHLHSDQQGGLICFYTFSIFRQEFFIWFSLGGISGDRDDAICWDGRSRKEWRGFLKQYGSNFFSRFSFFWKLNLSFGNRIMTFLDLKLEVVQQVKTVPSQEKSWTINIWEEKISKNIWSLIFLLGPFAGSEKYASFYIPTPLLYLLIEYPKLAKRLTARRSKWTETVRHIEDFTP